MPTKAGFLETRPTISELRLPVVILDVPRVSPKQVVFCPSVTKGSVSTNPCPQVLDWKVMRAEVTAGV